jgi:hypothetical protein
MQRAPKRNVWAETSAHLSNGIALRFMPLASLAVQYHFLGGMRSRCSQRGTLRRAFPTAIRRFFHSFGDYRRLSVRRPSDPLPPEAPCLPEAVKKLSRDDPAPSRLQIHSRKPARSARSTWVALVRTLLAERTRSSIFSQLPLPNGTTAAHLLARVTSKSTNCAGATPRRRGPITVSADALSVRRRWRRQPSSPSPDRW